MGTVLLTHIIMYKSIRESGEPPPPRLIDLPSESSNNSEGFRHLRFQYLSKSTFQAHLVHESIDFTNEKSLLCKGSLSKAPCGCAV